MSDTPLYADCTLVFDLDGTLVDTAPDLTAALNHVLAQEGYAPLPLSEVRNLVGLGARALIERGMRLNGRIPSGEDMQRIVRSGAVSTRVPSRSKTSVQSA